MRIGIADQVGSRIAVVAQHRIGAVGRRDRRDGAYWDHVATFIAYAQFLDVLNALPLPGVGLDKNAIDAAEQVEVIHIG